MEKVGFVGDDIAEVVEAYEQQVLGKKKIEGLELSPAQVDAGIGASIRRMQAMNRMDIPMMWRAVVRSGSKKFGPVVSLIPPRGKPASDASDILSAARLFAPQMAAGPESFDCAFAPDTPSRSIVEFAVAAVRAIGYTGDLQWTVRGRGLLPQ
ncbi:MAG: hypothetical protein EXQ79_00150 [Acidimicrobiia bacterium]|nr:hypothetical protein [Acidimicrobiia bacterium]